MEFVGDEFKFFMVDLKSAVKEIESKYKVDIEVQKINYGDVSFNCNLLVKKADIDSDRIEWNKVCGIYGLTNEDYKRVILIDGKRYQLKQINTRKRKYPIICTNVDNGDRVGFTVDLVKRIIQPALKDV